MKIYDLNVKPITAFAVIEDIFEVNELTNMEAIIKPLKEYGIDVQDEDNTFVKIKAEYLDSVITEDDNWQKPFNGKKSHFPKYLPIKYFIHKDEALQVRVSDTVIMNLIINQKLVGKDSVLLEDLIKNFYKK